MKLKKSCGFLPETEILKDEDDNRGKLREKEKSRMKMVKNLKRDTAAFDLFCFRRKAVKRNMRI